MRILVYGAGVVGSVFAAHLQEAGLDVTILARGGRLDYIRENGIVLEEINGIRKTVTGLNIIDQLEMEDAYGLVLMTIRRDQIEDLMPALAPHWNTPNVLFLMNSFAGPDDPIHDMGHKRVLMGFPNLVGVRKENEIRYIPEMNLGENGLSATVGELDGRNSSRLERIVQTFAEAGIQVSIESNIAAWLKTYLAQILPIAYALYRNDGSNNALAQDKKSQRLMAKAVREGLHVLKKSGVPITPSKHKSPLVTNLDKWISDGPAGEIINGRINASRDEFEMLAGEFKSLIKKGSIRTPALDELYGEV